MLYVIQVLRSGHSLAECIVILLGQQKFFVEKQMRQINDEKVIVEISRELQESLLYESRLIIKVCTGLC